MMLYILHHRKSSHVQYKSTSDTAIVQNGEAHPGEVVYEDPDRTAPGELKLTDRECPAYDNVNMFKPVTECPAYVTTTGSSPQPNTEAQLQSGYYEL